MIHTIFIFAKENSTKRYMKWNGVNVQIFLAALFIGTENNGEVTYFPSEKQQKQIENNNCRTIQCKHKVTPKWRGERTTEKKDRDIILFQLKSDSLIKLLCIDVLCYVYWNARTFILKLIQFAWKLLLNLNA